MNATTPKPAATADPRAGSALLTAVVFGSLIVGMLAGVLPMLLTEWKQNTRSSAQQSAFHLGESGIEEGIWAVREYGNDDQAWRDAGWAEASGGAAWTREFRLSEYGPQGADAYVLDEGQNGVFRVIVEKPEGSRVQIVSQGFVEGGDGLPQGFEAARYIETEFARPNPFVHGLIARDSLDFNGRPFFDSYDSRVFPHDYARGVNSGDNATVGSPSTDLDDFDLSNSEIRGDLATGVPDDGSDPFSGQDISGDVIHDFDMEFPEVDVPDTAGWKTSL